MAYSLTNMCAKHLCKQTVLVQCIIKNVVTFYWNTLYNFVQNKFCKFTNGIIHNP